MTASRLQGRKPGLDLLRGVAILSAILCHYLLNYWGIVGKWSYPFGVIAVEFFFVLSGYLIGGILLRTIAEHENRFSPHLLFDFWIRRWFRTIPNYLLFLAIMYRFPGDHSESVFRYLTFTQSAFGPPRFFQVSWSLAVEEWFYLLFPLLVFLLSLIFRRIRAAFFCATALMIIGPLVLKAVFALGMDWDTTRKITAFRLDSIMLGVVLAAVERHLPGLYRIAQRRACLVAGVALTVVLYFAINTRWQPSAADFVSTRGDIFWFYGINVACMLMIPFLATIERLPAALAGPVFYTSAWSYSLYLCHLPIMWEIDRKFSELLGTWTRASISLILMFAVSALIYSFFEQPALRLRERFRFAQRRNPKPRGSV